MPSFEFYTTPLDPSVDLLGLHEKDPQRFPFLLDSAAIGGSAQRTLGRYDILFCEPEEALVLSAEDLADGRATDFFSRLDALAPTRHGLGDDTATWPFRGGWFVFASYELAAQVETVLALPLDYTLPVALAVRVRSAVVRCHRSGQVHLISERAGTDDLLDAVSAATPTRSVGARRSLIDELKEEPADRYLNAVERAKEHIAAGDVFQANLSREWCATLAQNVRSVDIYQRLRAANPAPFAGLMVWGDQCVMSSSPERLVRLAEGRIDTRPIAGTRPRGTSVASDQAQSLELLGHPKERAEHVMLIDLERNDIGRVCRAGTVTVDEFMVLESYAHVHHIVSNVSGELEADIGPGQALRAVFPGGTITGCPKVRCMEIIADLERAPRGAYTGAMGYLNRDGSGDFNILIRTAVSDGRNVRFRAGAGIVADSKPEAELHETRAKARGLILALNPEHNGCPA
ncbi:MAG: aminodeoxychorismate synthase component I [Gammaproteobacteria bacterium]